MQNITPFYSHNPNNNFHQFSNFYMNSFNYYLPIDIILNKYPSPIICECSEKAIMLTKAALMNDREIFDKIINTVNPANCKLLGRKVKNFDQKLWNDNIHNIAYHVLIQKFTSNNELKKILLSTDNNIIVEATSNDIIWGCGLDIDDPNINNPDKWIGQNILGFTLMKVREWLKNNYVSKKLI